MAARRKMPGNTPVMSDMHKGTLERTVWEYGKNMNVRGCP